jgi:hypothetical protein
VDVFIPVVPAFRLFQLSRHSGYSEQKLKFGFSQQTSISNRHINLRGLAQKQISAPRYIIYIILSTERTKFG